MAMYNEITVEAELTNTEYMITKNYNLLENKPQINSVELMGNKSLEDLGINPDAEENIIDTVKVNGAALTPDANKAVNVTITTGTNNGTVKVNGTDVNIKGLKSAAYTESSDYDVSGAAAIVQGNVDALALVVNGKVDKVSGKGLSQNDYTNADKTKLAGIQAGAQVNTVTSVAGKTGAVTLNKSDVGLGNVDNTSDANKPISTATQTALDNKVDKVAGKGLSTNDFDNTYKDKLDGISEQANKVEITPVVTEGTTLATISIDGVDTDIKGSDIDVDDKLKPDSTNPVQNKVIYETLQNILPEETAEGNPISITDASGLNAKSCEVSFSPIQSGSGDPSPENVRPISGMNSVNLVRTGKNIYDYSQSTLVGTDQRKLITKLPDNSTLTISLKNNINGIYIYGSNDDFATKDTIVVGYTRNNLTFNTTNYAKYEITLYRNGGAPTLADEIQLELGSTATEYEPYQGTTHTATFPSTVYGGKVVWKDGVIKAIIDRAIVDLGSLTWVYNTSFTHPIFYAALPTKVNNRANTGLCSCYPVNPVNTTGAQNASTILNDNEIALSINTGSYHLFIRDESFTSSESLTEFLSGKQLCYELATPQEITLTPEIIELLKGNNVLSTDGDNITLKYSADIKAYIDSQLNS